MTTQTADTTTAPRETPMGDLRRPSTGWKTTRQYAGLVLIIIWGLAPFYWMIVTSFRQVGFTYDTSPWPTHVTLDNFKTAFSTSRGNHFGQALVNSVIIGVLTTAIAMLVGVFAAYALARLQFPGKYFVLGFILGASMFPGVALVSPLFSLFSSIHWLSGYNYQALIIPDISFALPLTVYTLTAFFSEMPWELEESARMDGCTPGTVHDRDPGLHQQLERVPPVVGVRLWEDSAGHGGHRLLHRFPATPGALHGGHGCRHDRHSPADHHGPVLPASDRLRSHGRRREGLTA
jgi:multiple sugar transport system permease protein